MKGVKDDLESVSKDIFTFIRYTHHCATQGVQGLEKRIQGGDRIVGASFPLQTRAIEADVPISEFVNEQQ